MTVKPFVKIDMRQRPLGASSGSKGAPAQAHFAARRASFSHGCCCVYPWFRAGAGTDPAVAYYPHTAAGSFQLRTPANGAVEIRGQIALPVLKRTYLNGVKERLWLECLAEPPAP